LSNYIAQSTVLVRADTTPFRAQLERAVKQADNKKVVVQVVPSTVGFASATNKALRDIKIAPVRVKVIPDLTGFKTAVRTAALDAVKGINIPVGIAPAAVATQRAAAGAAAGEVIDNRVSAAQKAVNAAVDAGVASRRRITEAMSAEDKVAVRLTREQIHLKAATDAVAKAALSGVPALLAQAEAEERAAKAAVAATTAQQERAALGAQRAALGVPRGVSLADFTAAEAAQKKFEEQRVALAAAATTRLTAESDARLAAEIKNLEKLVAADKIATDEIVANRAARLKTLQTQGAEFGAAQAAEQQARARTAQVAGAGVDTAAASRSAREIATSEELRARAARQQIGVTALLGDAEARLAAQRAVLRTATDAVTAATIAQDEALASSIVSTRAAAAEELRLAKIDQELAASRVASLETEVARAGRVGAGRRALEAFGANLAGLRGAALSAQGAFVATAAAAIALTKAVQSSAQFTSSLNVFKVTAGATADQMERVSATAQQLGADMSLPGVTAQDAAEALTELSKAGLSVQDSIDGARGVLQLATAASIDNAQATELAASALNAFGLAGNQAVRVADVLANAANDSQGSIVDVGVALQQSAAVARQAGLSLEQTVSVLTLFARAGLKGSDAGTSFRTALIRLINPTAKAQKEIDKLGLHLRTATGAINLDVFDEFAQKTRNLTAAQRDQALAIIFGQDAIRGAAILARTGAKGLEEQRLSLEKQGTAAELASARMSGLTGAMANLQNQLSTLGLSLGAVVSVGLTPMVNGISDALSVINKLAQGIVDLGNEAGKLPGILGDAKKELDKLFGGKGGGGQQQPRIKAGRLEVDDKDARNTVLKFIGFAGAQVTNFFKNVALIPVGPVRPLFDFITPDPKTVNEARNQVKGLVSDFNKVGGLSQLDESVRRLKKLSAEMRQGDEKSKAFAKDLDIFITRIQKLSSNPKIDPFELSITIPPELLSGDPGRLLGEANKREFLKAVFTPPSELAQAFGLTGLEDVFNKFDFTGFIGVDPKVEFDKFKNGFVDAAAAAQRDMRKARAKVDAVISGSEGRVAGIERSGVDLDIAGAGNPALLKNANAKIAAQAKVIAQEEKRRNQILEDTGRESNERLRAAKEKQAQFIKERDGILAAMKSDANQAKQDAQDKRDKADQAFLDALSVGRTPFSRAVERAQETPGANDNVNTLLAFRKRLNDEVKRVKAGVQDSKTKAAALQKLSDELFQNSQDINAARKARNEAIQQALADRGVALQNLGEVTGNFKLVLRGLDLQIESARQTLIKAKALKVGMEAARAALEQAKKARRDALNEFKNSVLDQGFALAEARGNKSAMLQIIDLQIAQAKAEEKQAKTLLDRLVAQTKIQELINKKRDILNEEIDKGNKGTSAFDLLSNALANFKDHAGNIINANQSIEGATGFTADIAGFLRKRGPIGIGTGTLFPGRDQANTTALGQQFRLGTGFKGGKGFAFDLKPQTDKNVALIDAINRWIATINNQATAKKSGGRGGVPTGGKPAGSRRFFVAAGDARDYENS